MPRLDHHAVLANGVHGLLANFYGAARVWAPVLCHPYYDRVVPMRNTAFVILAYALVEAPENFGARHHAMVADARRLGSVSCLHYLKVARWIVDSVVDLASCFSRNDMIIIGEMRQQWLHGLLHSRGSTKDREVRFIKDGHVVRKRVDHDTYWKVITPDFQFRRMEPVLADLRKKFSDHETLYWEIYAYLHRYIDAIKVEISDHGRQPVLPLPLYDLGVEITKTQGLEITKAQAVVAGKIMTLRQLRQRGAFGPEAEWPLDTVFASKENS